MNFSKNHPFLENYEPLDDIWAENDQILSSFQFYVSSGDLESAVRIMNQSSGETRRIFNDWMKETRLSLETTQILEAVKAIADTELVNIS